jgi:FkbH-like protein
MSALAPAEVGARRSAGMALLRADRPEATGLRILATFNTDLLPPFLADACARHGLAVAPTVAPFGQLAQEILDDGSGLYAEPPADVLLVPAIEDLLEPLFSQPPSRLGGDDADALVDERLAELQELVEALLERLPGASCHVVVFGTDRAPLGHVLDPRAPERRQAALERFADGVRRLSALSPRVVVVDWDWHVRGVGWDAVRDSRLWYLGRMRLGPTGCALLADLAARHLAAHRGNARKVLALDFDGLLWGGVVGEEGLAGIEVGGDGIGLAFQELQQELLLLHDTGVLLVACSKNNPDDAFEVFERHPGMVLRREHLAAERVNWQDKATNLRELADELALGLDSFVFLDDNPIERDWVRRACPEVLVPDVPDDPTERLALLRAAPWFARIRTTEADRPRAGSYQEQRERRTLRQATATFDDFLASLEQQVSIEPLHDGSVARAVQLCQRTNQFNLTTTRHTAADLEQLAAASDRELYTLSVRDRFGDSGITGFAILRHDGDEAVVDTLLMSCRVLGRKVEDAFLAFLAQRAAARGAVTLVGRFEPTAKNAQVASFYPDRGFAPDGDGVFRHDLGEGQLQPPPGFTIEVPSNA